MANSVLGAYASAFSAANAANEARYQSILGGYGDRESIFRGVLKNINKGYDSLVKRQERVGDSQRLDLQDQYARAFAKAKLSALSRGLGNSTLYDAAQRGVNSDLARAKIALEDSLSREYIDIYNKKLGFMERGNLFGLAGIAKDKLDFMERKQELGPQAALFAQLAEMEGRGNAGGFGGGGMGGGGMGMPSGGGARGSSQFAPFMNPAPRPEFVTGMYPGAASAAWQSGQFATNYANAIAMQGMSGMMGGAQGGGGSLGALGGVLGALGGASMRYGQQSNNYYGVPGGSQDLPTVSLSGWGGGGYPDMYANQYGPAASASVGWAGNVIPPSYSGSYATDAGVGWGGYFGSGYGGSYGYEE